MATRNPNDPNAKPRRKLFTVEEANSTLPLVRAIVADIVRQTRSVQELRERLAAIRRDPRRPADDIYSEEIAHSEAELAEEESSLSDLIDELARLGIELKGPDGLCDFPSLRDGRVVYLCWRLGEPEVQFWHELEAGFTGRQPLERPAQSPQPTF